MGPARGRPALVAAAAAASVLLVAAVAALFIRIPYDTIAPGSASRVDDLIAITGHQAYPPKGRLLFTTVSVRERVNLWEALGGWLDPDTDVVSDSDLRGPVPPDQYHQLNVEAMADSKSSAEAIVLRHLGFTDLAGGAEVVSIERGLPADAVLEAKDLIVGADGKPVTGPADVIGVIRAHKPGESVRLSVVRGGAPPAELTTTLGTGENGQALLGVRLSTKLKLPFGIAIDSGNVEGPSAGVAYSLALLDQLTPGELTGGARVAATGELGPDGVVAPIGGVTQKVAAVRRAGATVFLVPKENYAEAKAHAGSKVKVIPISTFDDALRALATLPASNAGDFVQNGAGAS
ncbi:MAG: YlbL family protein [Acidimicrobiales bacterium]